MARWSRNSKRVSRTSLISWGKFVTATPINHEPILNRRTMIAIVILFASANGIVAVISLIQSHWQPTEFVGHENSVAAVVATRDGSTIVSGGEDGTIRFWQENGKSSYICPGEGTPITTLTLSEDGERVAAGDRKGDLRVMAMWSRLDIDRFQTSAGIKALCLTENGSRLFVFLQDGRVIQRELAERRTEATRKLKFTVTTAVPSGDSAALLLGCDDGTVRNLDTRSWTVTWKVNCHAGPVSGLVIPAEGRFISGSTDRTLCSTSFGAARPEKRIQMESAVECLSITTGVPLVAGLRSGSVVLLNQETLLRIGEFQTNLETVLSCDVNSADQVVVGGYPGTLFSVPLTTFR